jgi:hypothetical protein
VHDLCAVSAKLFRHGKNGVGAKPLLLEKRDDWNAGFGCLSGELAGFEYRVNGGKMAGLVVGNGEIQRHHFQAPDLQRL